MSCWISAADVEDVSNLRTRVDVYNPKGHVNAGQESTGRSACATAVSGMMWPS
jgi:hypothetical protein